MAGIRVLLRVLEIDGASTLMRWDDRYIRPVTEMAVEVCRDVSEFLAKADKRHVVLGHRGDTLIVDNWRMLHGRSLVPLDAGERHIERAYMGELK